MNIVQPYLNNPVIFPILVFVVGLVVGSFLNVVIHRLPIMLDRRWRRQCEELAGKSPDAGKTSETFNLVVPRSRCPHCGHRISALENIPLISFLWLKGRCSACGTPISRRYPTVELLTAVLSVAVAWRFGAGAGAVAGYVSLWLVYQGFKILTGKEGMGFGDFKLLAGLGAWLGWQALPLVILFSSFLGAVVGLLFIVFFGRDRRLPIPFGPFLCLAGWVALLWGDSILRAYLQFARIG